MTFSERVRAARALYSTKTEAIRAANAHDDRAARCEKTAQDEETIHHSFGGLASHYREAADEHREQAFAIRALLPTLPE